MGAFKAKLPKMELRKLKSSVEICRWYKKAIRSIGFLAENNFMLPLERSILERQAELIYQELRRERKKYVRPQGRPRLDRKTGEGVKICKARGCYKPAAKGHDYCSKDHAPFGQYSDREKSKKQL